MSRIPGRDDRIGSRSRKRLDATQQPFFLCDVNLSLGIPLNFLGVTISFMCLAQFTTRHLYLPLLSVFRLTVFLSYRRPQTVNDQIFLFYDRLKLSLVIRTRFSDDPTAP